MIEEKRFEAVAAEFIVELASIQSKSDSTSKSFAERVLEKNGDFDREQAVNICERFLTGIGLVFRNQISKSVSRKQRLAAGRFEIHWCCGNHEAQWPELGESFPLENAIRLCADHFGGANQELEDAITAQFLSELHTGVLEIPRLKSESNSKAKSIFSWE